MKNGKLIDAVEKNGFDVLLTTDRNIPAENEIAGRKIGLVFMSTNNWKIVREHVPAILEGLHKCKPEQVLLVNCGSFKRRRAEKPGPA